MFFSFPVLTMPGEIQHYFELWHTGGAVMPMQFSKGFFIQRLLFSARGSSQTFVWGILKLSLAEEKALAFEKEVGSPTHDCHKAQEKTRRFLSRFLVLTIFLVRVCFNPPSLWPEIWNPPNALLAEWSLTCDLWLNPTDHSSTKCHLQLNPRSDGETWKYLFASRKIQ